MARVTVVNDSEEFLGVMHDILEALGHDGTTLKGETATVEEIADTAPDALVVDLILADSKVLMDGWAIVLGARMHPKLAEVPIVICSGDVAFLRERADEIAALADVHPLAKPFGVTDLESLLDGLLSR
jgi:CheY-like chemotaxis protein